MKEVGARLGITESRVSQLIRRRSPVCGRSSRLRAGRDALQCDRVRLGAPRAREPLTKILRSVHVHEAPSLRIEPQDLLLDHRRAARIEPRGGRGRRPRADARSARASTTDGTPRAAVQVAPPARQQHDVDRGFALGAGEQRDELRFEEGTSHGQSGEVAAHCREPRREPGHGTEVRLRVVHDARVGTRGNEQSGARAQPHAQLPGCASVGAATRTISSHDGSSSDAARGATSGAPPRNRAAPWARRWARASADEDDPAARSLSVVGRCGAAPSGQVEVRQADEGHVTASMSAGETSHRRRMPKRSTTSDAMTLPCAMPRRSAVELAALRQVSGQPPTKYRWRRSGRRPPRADTPASRRSSPSSKPSTPYSPLDEQQLRTHLAGSRAQHGRGCARRTAGAPPRR